MSQAKDLNVRLKALDGSWEVCGVDRARGIAPENEQLSWNPAGPDQATFDLRRDPKAVWPDLTAFTPVTIDSGGTRVWSGRIRETPAKDGSDRVISVAAEGWQYHLDDDLYEAVYVHDRLTDWTDVRSNLTAPLVSLPAAASVQAGSAAILLGFPTDCTVLNGAAVAVILDLGPNAPGQRLVVNFENQGVVAGFYQLYGKALDDPADLISGGDTCFAVDPGSAGSPQSGSTTGAKRYFAIVMLRTGSSAVENGDRLVRITSAQVFGDPAYESGNTSILKASDVVIDALARGTKLISSDRSGITATSFSIPEFAPSGPHTPREQWDAVNAYHNWNAKIDEYARAIFKPLSSRPRLVAGAWSAMEFTDAAMNSGADIYSRVIVTGQTPTGDPIRVDRQVGDQGTAVFLPITSPAPTNPSMDTNTTGCSLSNVLPTVTLARDTVVYEGSPGSLRIDYAAGGPGDSQADITGTFTGTFKEGVTYRLTLATRPSTPGIIDELATQLHVWGDTATGDVVTIPTNQTAGVFGFTSSEWTPKADTSSVTLTFLRTGGSGVAMSLWIDSLRLEQSVSSLPERRGFRRSKNLQVNARMAADGIAAAQIGDAWLSGHLNTAFKGTVTLTGDDALRDRRTGMPVPLERIGLATGELLHLSDRVNPDDGRQGRDGRITQVQWSAETNQAVVTLDQQRADFDALLARLAVVVGSG